MTGAGSLPTAALPVWLAAIVLLLALRLPSLVQPAGGDQGLYGYSGQRILAGGVMYHDMWDQKPPALAFVYAGLWRLHRTQAVVPAADLVAAAGVAWALVVLGTTAILVEHRLRRRGHLPASRRSLSSAALRHLVRGQAEPFIALAIVASLVMLAESGSATVPPCRCRRGSRDRVLAEIQRRGLRPSADGCGRGVGPAVRRNVAAVAEDLGWIVLGFVVVGAAVLAYFAAHGALEDLRLATLDYNLRYSNETYDGILRARPLPRDVPDRARPGRTAVVRGRPGDSVAPVARTRERLESRRLRLDRRGNRFNRDQRRPEPAQLLRPGQSGAALAASAGLATAIGASRWVRYAVVVLLLGALWRVGSDTPLWGLRPRVYPGPGRKRALRSRLHPWIGRSRHLPVAVSRAETRRAGKRAARALRSAATTTPAEFIFVFGFSGGSVCQLSERVTRPDSLEPAGDD